MADHAQHAVLVVDDNQDVLQVLELVLESEGYEVSKAKDGEEALRVLSNALVAPCVVVLDLMMPVVDGLEFLERLTEIPSISAVPVILISASSAPESVRNHPNVRKVFRKPFPFLGLINAIEACCGRCSPQEPTSVSR